MSIGSFIRLSTEYAKAVEAGSPSLFVSRRLCQLYNELSTPDRLRIHGIIDRENYLEKPPEQFAGKSPDDIAHTLDTIYGLLLDYQKDELLASMNGSAGTPPESFRKVAQFGQIPTFIGLDLGIVKLGMSRPLPDRAYGLT